MIQVTEKRKAKEAAAAVPAKAKAAVWSIDDVDDDDVELVDSDQLLGEEDLAKPDPASLRGKSEIVCLACRESFYSSPEFIIPQSAYMVVLERIIGF